MPNHSLVDQYVESCKICGTYPNKVWTQQFFSGKLNIDISKLVEKEAEVLSHAIMKSETPDKILITCSRNVHNEDKLVYKKILKSLARSLQISRSLKQVSFCNCNFYSDFLSVICQGLKQATAIDALVFDKCKFSIKFTGLETLCSAIKNVASISKFSVENCGLQSEDAIVIKNLIMHQSMNRTSFMWHETLRFQEPELDSYIGLRHIILNNNPAFGDDGLESIADGLMDDIWITGIELENCGIQTAGANKILQLLRTNEIINFVNIDNNPFIDKSVVDEIYEILKERRDREWDPKNSVHLSEDSNNEVKSKKTDLSEVIGQKKVLCSRFFGRRPVRRKRIQSASPLRSSAGDAKEVSDGEQVYLLLFREMREHLQSELRHERHRRQRAERKLEKRERKIKNLKGRLNSRFLMDEQTMINIENSFAKFQQFLIKLQQVGENTPSSQHEDPSGSEVDSLQKIVSEFLENSSRADPKENNIYKDPVTAPEKNYFPKSTGKFEVITKHEKEKLNKKSSVLESVLKSESQQKYDPECKTNIVSNSPLNSCQMVKKELTLSGNHDGVADEPNYLVIDREVGNISAFGEGQNGGRNEINSVHEPANEEPSCAISYESQYASSNKPDDSKVSGNILTNIKFVTLAEASDQYVAAGNNRSTHHLALSETDEEKLKVLETKGNFQNNSSPNGHSLSNHSSYTDVLTEDLSGVEDLSITTLSSL